MKTRDGKFTGRIQRFRHNLLRAVVVALVVFAVSGCIEIETRVVVRPDGSGLIEQRLAYGALLLGFMEPSQMPAAKVEDPSGLVAAAAQFGPGVEFVGVEPFQTEMAMGYAVTYKFPSIAAVVIDQNPNAGLPTEMADNESAPELVTFEFTGGNPRTLRIHTPVRDIQGEGPSAAADMTDSMVDSEEFAMMSTFFQGFRVATAVEIEGQIVSTNAGFRDGNTITLMDVDFAQLFESPDTMMKLAAMSNQTSEFTALMAQMNAVPGFKVEPQPTVEVRFR